MMLLYRLSYREKEETEIRMAQPARILFLKPREI
jgi:hypothetical protein